MNVRLLCLLCVVYVAASATGLSLSNTEMCVPNCVCDVGASTMRGPRPDMGRCATVKAEYYFDVIPSVHCD